MACRKHVQQAMENLFGTANPAVVTKRLPQKSRPQLLLRYQIEAGGSTRCQCSSCGLPALGIRSDRGDSASNSADRRCLDDTNFETRATCVGVTAQRRRQTAYK